jgi:hypothetical protein
MHARMFFAAILLATVACGGDGDDGETSGNGTTGVGTDSSSGTDPGSSSGEPDPSSSESSSESSTAPGTTTDPTDADSSSTGDAPSDPSYPRPDGGTCPDDTVPIALPGANVCGPFCAGADAACPDPSSGDATPVCTPFADEGGSGTPCVDHGDCDGGEACGADDTCVAVAFWACRLECAGGETCSDGMTCTQDACGYP